MTRMKTWMTQVMKALNVTEPELRAVPGIGPHIHERKVGPNMGYMVTSEGVELAEKHFSSPNGPEQVRIVLRPRNKGLLICRSGEKEYRVKVRDNKNWSVGQQIEVTPDGDIYQLATEWRRWEMRKIR